MAGINWLGVLQPQDASLPAQPGGCAQCHPGLGAKPNYPPTEADLANVDCLICHSPDYGRTVVQDEEGKARLVPAEEIDVLVAAQNAQRPTADMCQRCHFTAAGGPNFKHGDAPLPTTDVHIAAGMVCVDCHTTETHQIAGGGYLKAHDPIDLEVEVACANCHTDQPHESGAAALLNMHTVRVACQTCHIPAIARDPQWPTMLSRDYTQSVYNETSGLYGPTHEMGSNLIPDYYWWNGRMASPPIPVGSMDDPDSRITPWKDLSFTVPFDAETDTPIYIKQGTYKITGDLEKAIAAGVEASGQEYSGSWEAVTEEMSFDVNHSVAPAAEALQCANCHSPEGRLDFVALGYSQERATALQSLSAAVPPPQAPEEPPAAEPTPEAPVAQPVGPALPVHPIEAYQGPETCALCHDDRHTRWQAGPHANAYSDPIFQESWQAQGQPKYCLACHTTGFNPVTGEYATEGVTCEQCHAPYTAEHPPGRMPVDRSLEVCGTCHTVSYDEWERSAHADVGTDCLSCHEVCALETHEPGEGVTAEHPAQEAVCANCHHGVVDEFIHTTHAGVELDCLTCHMQIGEDDLGPEGKIRTAHDFAVKANVCVACHADSIHGGDRIVALEAAVDELRQVVPMGVQEEVTGLRAQVADLESLSTGKLWAGGTVGALAGLVVGAAVAWLWRRQSL